MSDARVFDPVSIIRRAEAHHLKEQGLGTVDIAERTGMSERHILRYLATPKPKLVQLQRSQAWRDEAACLNKPQEWFFPSCTGLKAQALKRKAIATCQQCPVIKQCRQSALATFENHGIWAGEDFSRYSYRFNEDTGEVLVSVRRNSGTDAKVS